MKISALRNKGGNVALGMFMVATVGAVGHSIKTCVSTSKAKQEIQTKVPQKYNQLIEQENTGKRIQWEKISQQVNDSLKQDSIARQERIESAERLEGIARKAYIEGAQRVKDGVRNARKVLK